MITGKSLNFIADVVAPLVGSPVHLERLADELVHHNPKFNRDKFLDRAIAKWEETHDISLDEDHLPY